MSDLLAYGFLQRALTAGTLLAVTCAVLSFFVVLRRLAFVGVGLSHAALGGVALGLVAGLPPLLGAGVFTVAVAWTIAWIGGRGTVSEDTAIGVFFPLAMALGVIVISVSPAYRQDLLGYLFGNILAVGPGDLLPLAGLCVVTTGAAAWWFKELLYAGVDEEAARAAGIPVTGLRYLLLTLLAVTIVAAVRLVGIVLVSAFLVIPAATGQSVARSLPRMLAVSVASAVLSVWGGLALSWWVDLPSGATIVMVSGVLFFAALATGRLSGPG